MNARHTHINIRSTSLPISSAVNAASSATGIPKFRAVSTRMPHLRGKMGFRSHTSRRVAGLYLAAGGEPVSIWRYNFRQQGGWPEFDRLFPTGGEKFPPPGPVPSPWQKLPPECRCEWHGDDPGGAYPSRVSVRHSLQLFQRFLRGWLRPGAHFPGELQLFVVIACIFLSGEGLTVLILPAFHEDRDVCTYQRDAWQLRSRLVAQCRGAPPGMMHPACCRHSREGKQKPLVK